MKVLSKNQTSAIKQFSRPQFLMYKMEMLLPITIRIIVKTQINVEKA